MAAPRRRWAGREPRAEATNGSTRLRRKFGKQPTLEHLERTVALRAGRMHQPVTSRRMRERQRPADRSKALALDDERFQSKRDPDTLLGRLYRCYETID